MLHYGDYQMEIYRAGLNGRLPKLPVDFRELEARAHAAMPPGLVVSSHYAVGEDFRKSSELG